MATSFKRTNPADAANIFARCLLSEAGELLGGFSESEWNQTLEFFDHRCAYTGQSPADDEPFHREHAIPINRFHCGLHLFGNVVPSTKEANRQKAGTHFSEFVTDPSRRARIERFLDESGYVERVARLGDLRNLVQTQYDVVTGLCGHNRDFLRRQLGLEDVREAVNSEALPITLDPENEADFKTRLLVERRAWIQVSYEDGRVDLSEWNAFRFSDRSSVMGNLRARPQFRQGEWQRNGISSVLVSIERPE